jgi:hypothetical protein
MEHQAVPDQTMAVHMIHMSASLLVVRIKIVTLTCRYFESKYTLEGINGLSEVIKKIGKSEPANLAGGMNCYMNKASKTTELVIPILEVLTLPDRPRG